MFVVRRVLRFTERGQLQFENGRFPYAIKRIILHYRLITFVVLFVIFSTFVIFSPFVIYSVGEGAFGKRLSTV